MLRLRKVVLKPTLFCYHRCSYCHPRQDYFREMLRASKALPVPLGAEAPSPGHIPVELALNALTEARHLGMSECLFSGGDPLLYPHLTELVRAAAGSDGVFVYLNSVGWAVRKDRVLELINAGLDAWNFSIDSIDPAKYDTMRGRPGAFRRFTHALDEVLTARATHRGDDPFFVNFMTVITRQTFRDLPALVKAAIQKGVSSIYLMNVYGDSGAGGLLLTRQDIRDFRRYILPEILSVLHDAAVPEVVYFNARDALATFYSPDNWESNYETGIWWHDLMTAKDSCRIPEYCVHIEPDGIVLPCCLLEVFDTEPVGDLRLNGLSEIWQGPRFERFRNEKAEFCLRCPVQRNRTLGLIPELCRQFGD